MITQLARREEPARIAGSPVVVLDGCAFQEPWGGIARVWRSILDEWAASGFADHVLIVNRGDTAPQIPGFHYLIAPVVRVADDPSQRRLLGAICDHYDARVFISTGYTYPDAYPTVLLMHDMTPEVLEWDLGDARWREKRLSIDHASAFVCVSHNTESDLHRFYPGSAERPSVVALNGVDPFFHPAPADDVQALRNRFDLPERYLVFIGHREGYKNAALLFDALALSEDDPGFGLLLVGGASELERPFAESARRLPVRIARLADAELRAAYTGAAALVYPSRYEGFGLPIAEAMACGCPVITCRNSSLPEVGGDAALYVDESDPTEMLSALRRVTDPSLRAELSAKGMRQAATFRWSTSAEVIRQALLDAANSA